MKSKKFQDHVTALVFALGSSIQSSLSISAESDKAGEFTAAPPISVGVIYRMEPTSLPLFYILGKPKSVGPRAINTGAFTITLKVICLNRQGVKPISILMCNSELMGIACKLDKKVVVFMVKNIK